MENNTENTLTHFKGNPISEGIVSGKTFVFKQIDLEALEKNRFPVDDVTAELERFEKAIKNSRVQLREIQQHMNKQTNEEIGSIFQAHEIILKDENFIDNIKNILLSEKVNVEHIIAHEIKEVAVKFEAIENELIKTRFTDIQDVYHRLLRNLLEIEHVHKNSAKKIDEPVVFVAKKLVASDLAMLDFENITGIIIEEGSTTSHVAVISRSLGVPAVINIPGISSLIKTDETVIVDGYEGTVIVAPSQNEINDYLARKKKYDATDATEAVQFPEAGSLCVTKDGVAVNLEANVNTLNEAKDALIRGAKGIGLLRTEFFYMASKVMPTIENEYEFLKAILEIKKDFPVTIRLLDLGADKSPLYLHIAPDENPQLGLRGIRYLLKYPEILTKQLQSIFKAAGPGKIKILIPFIAIEKDLESALKIINESCLRSGVKREDLKVGIMVEVPSVALSIKNYIEKVDFISIGTNDLVQYTFAVSRENGTLDNYRQPLHPVILNMINNVISCCGQYKKELAICGEIVSDPLNAGLLVGLGMRSFSMQPKMIPAVKKELSEMYYKDLKEKAEKALDCRSSEEVMAILK